MMENYITISLTYAIIGVVMYAIANEIYKDNGNEIIKNLKEEQIIIRLPKVYKWVGIGVVIAIFIGLVLINIFPIPTSSSESWVVVGLGIFTLLGLFLVWAQIFWRIDVYRHGDHFVYSTVFRTKHKIYYSDIIYYKLRNNYIHIKTKRKLFLIDDKAVCVEFLMASLSTNKVKEVKPKKQY